MSNKKLLNDNEKPKDNLRQTQKKKSKRQSKIINKSLTYDKDVVKNDVTTQVTNFEVQFRLERTSTPHFESMCEHCNHFHKKECCMYIYDTYEDIHRYAEFKKQVEEPYSVVKSGEDFAMKIGATTPSYFPAYTENNSDAADMRALTGGKPCVYLRQYFWPFHIPPTYQLLPTPVYNANQITHNPQNLKYYQPHVFVGSHHQPSSMTAAPYMQLPMPYQPYQRQIPIPLHHGNPLFIANHKNPHPQVIEYHNYVPISMNSNQNYYYGLQ